MQSAYIYNTFIHMILVMATGKKSGEGKCLLCYSFLSVYTVLAGCKRCMLNGRIGKEEKGEQKLFYKSMRRFFSYPQWSHFESKTKTVPRVSNYCLRAKLQ